MTKMQKSVLALSGVAFAVTACGAFGVLSTASAQTEPPRAVSELFLPSEIALTPSYIPEDSEAGASLLMTTEKRNAKVGMADDISGDFSFTFAPVAEGGSTTLKTLSVYFTETTTGENFSLTLSFGQTNYAYVELDGDKAGLAYYNGKLYGCTGYENASGAYTSFTAETVSVSFDVEKTAVYVGAEGSELLVWDFSEPTADYYEFGKTLGFFEKYSVTLEIEDFAGESSGFMLYSVNGCPLDKVVLDGVSTPRVAASVAQKGLKGEKFVVPTAAAYDLIDGQLSGVTTEVYNPLGEVVTLDKNVFTPTRAGEYVVKYTATNSQGNTATQEYKVEILAELPEISYEFVDFKEFPETAAIGESCYVPQMRKVGGSLTDESSLVTVTMLRNGWEQVRYTDVESGFTYTFEKDGEYTFVYNAGELQRSYTVTVADVDESVVLDYDFQASYEVNDYLDITSAKLLVRGVDTAYETEITYPDGNVYANKRFVLSQAGSYTLTAYSAATPTQRVTRKIIVNENVTSLFSSNSSEMTFTRETSMMTGVSGVSINTSSYGATAVYNQVIDLSRYTGQTAANEKVGTVYGETNVVLSETATPFIELSVQPHKYGVVATDCIYVTLTDVYDENNSIKIIISKEDSSTWTYVRAAAGEQDYGGLYAANNSFRTNGMYGHMLPHSFAGKPSSAAFVLPENSRVALFYDHEEKKLLTKGTPGSNRTAIIADFDNPLLCNGAVWDGFTTGEVVLSVELGRVYYDKASCIVYSVDGVDLTGEAVEYGKPQIQIDGRYLEGLKGESFAIPTAKALDSSGSVITNVTTRVVYVAANGKEYDVNVQNGAFATERAGTYYVRYFATDKFGNEAVAQAAVAVHETYEALSAEVSVSEEYSAGKTGQSIPVYPSKDVAVYNALGEVKKSVAVTFNGEAVEIDADGAFTPVRAGDYTVTYTLTDGVGRKATASYEVAVELETELVLQSTVPVYVGFIEGNTYTLQDVYVIDYTAENPVPQKADVYVDDVKQGATYTPTVSETEGENAEEVVRFVTLKYKYDGREIAGLSYTLPVRNVYKEKSVLVGTNSIKAKAFRADRYFYAEEGMSVAMSSSVTLTATKDGAKAYFIQSQQAEGLKMTFDVTGKNEAHTAIDTNVKKLHFYITDATDASKVVQITVAAETGTDGKTKTQMYVNGVAAIGEFTGSLDGTSRLAFGWTLNVGTKSLVDTQKNTRIAWLDTYLDGRKFEGFKEKVFISIEIERKDSTKASAIQISALNTQNFSINASNDTVAPSLKANARFESVYPYQSTVTIPTATASDVLSDVKEILVTVLYSTDSGEVSVTDVNGTLLENVSATTEYQVLLSQTGTYRVVYTAKDTRGGKAETSTTFDVSVSRAPIITLKGSWQETVKVGTTVSPVAFEVEFAEENAENLAYAIYIAPSDRYQYIYQDNTVTFSEVGKYTIRYFALDGYGNYTITEYTVNVVA